MQKPLFSEGFKKQYKKLPLKIQKKFLKQLKYLLSDYRHPSLQTRKEIGNEIFEARVDYHYRFTFILSGDEIWLLTIGPHDEGLGKM